MKEVKTINMSLEQLKRYKAMKDDMFKAEMAYHIAGEYTAKLIQSFWEEIHEVFSLPKDSKPVIKWDTCEITYLEDELKK